MKKKKYKLFGSLDKLILKLMWNNGIIFVWVKKKFKFYIFSFIL